jgi:hypothetical protein
MALNANGDLYIFELKAWESQPSNLLQALRYGQVYGQYDSDRLESIYKTAVLYWPSHGLDTQSWVYGKAAAYFDPWKRNIEKLNNYRKLRTPLSAGEIKQITEVNYVFMSTMFSIDAESGRRIEEHIKNNLL